MANEKRLIDAYKLEDLVRSNSARYHHVDDVIAAIAGQPTVDAVEVVHDRLFNLPRVSNRDYKDFVDGLEDYFKEAAFEDRSVGIFGMTEGETLLANALMEFLNGGTKMDGDGNG